MRRVTLILACAVIFVFALSNQTNAAVPQLINYQGRVTDSAGVPLDGPFDIVQFTIYDADSAGNAIWFEEHTTVVVIDGLFSVLLGSLTELVDTVFNDTSRYLGISLDGGVSEIIPRTRLVTAPYSFRSEQADVANFATLSLHADTADFADTAALAVLALVAELAIFADSSRVADEIDSLSSEDFSRTGHSHGGGWSNLPVTALYNSYVDAHGDDWRRIQYRKIGDIVYLRGLIHKVNHESIPNGPAIAILPPGFRPPETLGFFQARSRRIDILQSGEIRSGFTAVNTDFAFLDGIFFSTSP